MRCSTSGKDVFFTEPHADGAIQTYKKRSGIELRKYRCPSCQWWHLTKGRVREVDAVEQKEQTL